MGRHLLAALCAILLLGAGGADPLAFGGGGSSDTVPLLGPLPGVAIGVVLLVAGFAVGVLRLVWRDDRRSVIVVTIFLALAVVENFLY